MVRRKARERSCLGCRKKSSGLLSSKITPSSMKTTLDDTFLAKFISWVTTSMVMPSWASCRMTASTSPVSSGSRAEVGSSKRMISGSVARPLAIATRCCCPPESWLG